MARIMCALGLIGLTIAITLSGAVNGQYTPDWASLDKRPIPTWYDDAKFGIFIHWGVYSVPSWAPVGTYAEWYWNALSDPTSDTSAFHNRTYGATFRYADFADMFKAELFNATEWADIFARSGAKYIVPTSKHHEGFTLWPSSVSWNWNAVDVGPHRDLLKELFDAVRDRNLHPCLYYSLYEWYHPLYIGPNPSQYVDQVMLPQLTDLVNNYRPELIWGDGDWEHNSTFWKTPEFVAWLYNESPAKDTIVINDRFGIDVGHTHGGFYTPEYSTTIYLDHKWEENSGIDIHSYGLNRNTPADKYNSASDLINLLIRCIANGGNFLLDIGPSADGSIPAIMVERLLQIGAWLNVNGEAVYGSRYWRVQQEGPIDETSIRYTRSNKGNDNENVYAFLLQWPGNDDNSIFLPSPKVNDQSKIGMLGYDKDLAFTPDPSGTGVKVTLPRFAPGQAPCDYVWVLKLQNVQ